MSILHQQVEVVVHQAGRVCPQAPSLGCDDKQRKETVPILFVNEHGLTSQATVHHVVPEARGLDS